MKHIKSISLIFFFSFFTQGCSTVIAHSGWENFGQPYLGTSKAAKRVVTSWSDYEYFGEIGFYIWDVPLCLVADTVILPWDAYVYFKN